MFRCPGAGVVGMDRSGVGSRSIALSLCSGVVDRVGKTRTLDLFVDITVMVLMRCIEYFHYKNYSYLLVLKSMAMVAFPFGASLHQ